MRQKHAKKVGEVEIGLSLVRLLMMDMDIMRMSAW